MNLSEQTIDRAETAPSPKHRPEADPGNRKPGLGYVVKRALNTFTGNGCTDLAASLTYFTVLSVFPGLLAVVSLLGVFGQGQQTANALLDFIRPYAPSSMMELIQDPITQLATSRGAGLALVTGVVGALWTASGYVGGFGRALNRIYGVVEGRPVWKLRPINLLVTFLMVVIVVVIMLTVLLSGGVLQFFGDKIGLGGTAVAVWNWARWIVVLVLAVVLVALLYAGTPNVRQPKLRLLSPGALFALVMMAVSGAAFGFYVSNFGNYNATYGALGGVIVMLLLIWIMNNVLLLGAVLDAELERSRQLEEGLPAEEDIQLPPRDTRQAEKMRKGHAKLVEEARRVRLGNTSVDYSKK